MYEMQIIDNAGKCDYCEHSAAFLFTYSREDIETASYRTCPLCSILFTGDAATVAAASNIVIRARQIEHELTREYGEAVRRFRYMSGYTLRAAESFAFSLENMLEAHPLPSLLQ